MPSLRSKLISELNKIPKLEKIVLRGKHEGFTCFNVAGKEVAHFDNDNELDVRLKKLLSQKALLIQLIQLIIQTATKHNHTGLCCNLNNTMI